MKVLLIAVILSISILTQAQVIEPISGVVYFKGATAQQVHKKALMWLALDCNSSTDVIHLKEDNHPTGEMIYKGRRCSETIVPYQEPVCFTYNMIIRVADRHFRYTIQNLKVISGSLEQVNFEITKIKESFQELD